jgi:MFS family permease
LGAVSLLNDAASEMIAPLLPLFLTATLGAGPAVVGLVEGVAEATASVLKLVSGRLADRGWNSKGLVVGGYGASNAARPLIGMALGWGWVLALRFVDRAGKGLRTSPRDALIAAAVPAAIRGRAFGFHRAMDHVGAVVGPLLAFYLLQEGVGMPTVFLLSVLPGALVVFLLLLALPSAPPDASGERAALRWRGLDARLRGLIVAAAGLALATTPEVFLVLWAQARGLPVVWVPLIWAAAHVAKALVTLPAGTASDRFGRLPVVVVGWGLRILVLVRLALAVDGILLVWSLFLGYAAALAVTEPAERALIGDFAPPDQKATAYGLYHLASGVMALPGGVLFGLLWQHWGMGTAFLSAAGVTALAALALLSMARQPPQVPKGA